MSEQTNPTPPTPPSDPTPPAPSNATPPDAPTPPVSAAPSPSQTLNLGPGVIAVPTNTFEKVKTQAYAKGQKEALAPLAAKAAELGFESVDAMLKFAEAQKKAAPPVPPIDGGKPAPDGAPVDGIPSRYAAELTAAQTAAQAAQAAAEAAQKEIERVRAESEAKVFLVSAGVKDVNYALYELGNHLNSLPEDQAAAPFDIAAWADTLKASKPYLFATQTAPANTVPAAANNPPPVNTPNPNSGGQKLAADMTPAEFAAAMKKFGVTPTVGS